jgi:hypothetical protein
VELEHGPTFVTDTQLISDKPKRLKIPQTTSPPAWLYFPGQTQNHNFTLSNDFYSAWQLLAGQDVLLRSWKW